MAKFVSLINWTEQGATAAAQTVERAAQAKALAATMGGSFEIYWTMGQYDMVAVLEFKDDETAAAFLAKVVSQGNLRSSTMRAFDTDEVAAITSRS